MLKPWIFTESVPSLDRVAESCVTAKSLTDKTVKANETLNWKQFANCKGKMRLFFPPQSERPQARQRREAKAQSLCRLCSVQTTCLEFAREHHEYGFWGGESEEKRHLAGFTVAAPIGVRARSLQIPLADT